MATWPCPTILDCECSDNPLRNLTSENPDPLTFFARVFPPFPVTINGPVDTFWAPGCVSDCFSTVSQFDAEACALRQATVCNNTPPTGNPAGPELFGNEPQSCEALCPMGDPFVYSIPAGTFLAVNQELANLIAQSFCLEQAIESRMCEGMPPGPPNTVCPTITGVSPAGPINANVGDNITLTATYTFPGSPSALIFVWFLNGSPIAILHDDPTLHINDIMESEEGDYTLGIFASGCDPVFSNPITINVGCVAEVPPPAAPASSPEDGIYDYDTLVSHGVFTAMADVVLDPGGCPVSGTEGFRVYTNCGAFSAGYYNVTINSGGGWLETHLFNPGAIPTESPLMLGIGVEMQFGGFPFEVVNEAIVGCFGWDFPPTSCPDPTVRMEEHFGQPYPINVVFAQEHSGGDIRIWGPIIAHADATNTNNAVTPCGGNVQMEIFEHVLEPMPLNLQIVHFDDFANLLQVCSTCQDRVGIEWDGTLERVLYTPFILSYQIGAPFSSATISLNGKRISTSSVEIILTEDPPGTPVWKLTIKCKEIGQPNGGGSGQIIWSGIKAKGRSPAGVYVSKEEACNPGKNPECCRIEEI